MLYSLHFSKYLDFIVLKKFESISLFDFFVFLKFLWYLIIIMNIFIKIRNTLAALSALSFLFLFFSWNLCIPFGCSVDPIVCDTGNCIGESFSQHLKERSILSNSTPRYQLSLFIVVLLIIFAIFRNDINLRYFSILQRLKINKNRFICKLYNIFVIFFSKGILHPKTF